MASSDEHGSNAQLTAYRCLLDNARAMLKAARESRWEELIRLESQRDTCLKQVMQFELVSTNPADTEACSDLIQRILECDEQTKVLVQAWQSELIEVLGSIDNQKKLSAAYG